MPHFLTHILVDRFLPVWLLVLWHQFDLKFILSIDQDMSTIASSHSMHSVASQQSYMRAGSYSWVQCMAPGSSLFSIQSSLACKYRSPHQRCWGDGTCSSYAKTKCNLERQVPRSQCKHSFNTCCKARFLATRQVLRPSHQRRNELQSIPVKSRPSPCQKADRIYIMPFLRPHAPDARDAGTIRQ